MKIDDILLELKAFAQNHNLIEVEPRILSESANLIVHLFPYDIVARVAVYSVKNEIIKDNMIKEITVAKHLNNSGVAVIHPCETMAPGPHECSNHWFTLWQYEEKFEGGKLTSDLIVSSIQELMSSMLKYPDVLPSLGVWLRVQASAQNLAKIDDPRVKTLLNHYERLNDYIISIEEQNLVPSHGDSHFKNLFPAKENWLWMDFEDASLMPKYWDLASVVSNIVLLKGLETPIVQLILNNNQLISNHQEFFMILKARMLMSIIGNLDMALRNLGDLAYAEWQLNKYEQVFKEIDDIRTCQNLKQ